MAVITELIDAGLRLKQGGNLSGAIEHFKQLQATYPGHARIMFELAACWRAFHVPEQALPLYRELLALPKGQGLPPKDMPRLYTQLGATLLDMGDNAESLAIIDEGLRLHPSYRSLRAWRIFALARADSHQLALLDALELMLESLAPSRWDIFEAEIKTAVKAMRASLPAQDTPAWESAGPNALADVIAVPAEDAPGNVESPNTDALNEADVTARRSDIAVESQASGSIEVDVEVNILKPTKKRKTSRKRETRPQLGKKAVRIDISGEADAPAEAADDDEPPAPSGAFKIPIEPE